MNAPATPARGIVLFAHGSRDPQWHAPIQAVAARIRELDGASPVVCAYLELTMPDLPNAVAQLLDQGVTAVTVLPMFLGVGRHAREDLPALMSALRGQHPAIAFTLLPAAGEDPRLIELMARIALS